jgi:phosphoribosyl transferase domain
MKKYEIKQILKRCAKSIGIIPSNCIFCLKDLELERLKKDNNMYEYICKNCSEKYKGKFDVYVDVVKALEEKNTKHIYLGKYDDIKEEIMNIKYFDKQYILKGIMEITYTKIEKEIFEENIENSHIIMLYIPTTFKKSITRGNISKYICMQCLEEMQKKGNITIDNVFVCTIAKIRKDIEIKKLNKEERKRKIKEKYLYVKDNFLEKYFKKCIKDNRNIYDFKIIIIDDVYTTGSTMRNMVEMLEKNILKEIEGIKRIGKIREEKILNIEYIFLSLAKD